LEGELKSQKERSASEGKRLAAKIKKLSKVVSSQLESLKKENTSIVHFLKTRAAILQNDDSILRSTFHKELVHHQLLLEREKEVIVRSVKTEATDSANAQVKAIKLEFEERVKETLDKAEADKSALRNVIKEKEGKMEEMVREQKRLTG
jgi:hypothetical protein